MSLMNKGFAPRKEIEMKLLKKVVLSVASVGFAANVMAFDLGQTMTNIVSNAITSGTQQTTINSNGVMNGNPYYQPQQYNNGNPYYQQNQNQQQNTQPGGFASLGSMFGFGGMSRDEVYAKVVDGMKASELRADSSFARIVTPAQCTAKNTLAKIQMPPHVYENSVAPKFVGTGGNYFDLFAVSSADKLLRGRPNQNFVAVAVPSLEALSYFDNINITDDVKMNSSAILVTLEMAQAMRAEMASRNVTPQNSEDLRDFTAKQLASLAMAVSSNPWYKGRSMSPFFDAAVTAYARGKQMCVYDSK